MRTTRAELDQLCAIINRATDGDYEVQYAYGRPRLVRANGSVDVSPRLSTGELAQWMRAMLTGIEAGRAKG